MGEVLHSRFTDGGDPRGVQPTPVEPVVKRRIADPRTFGTATTSAEIGADLSQDGLTTEAPATAEPDDREHERRSASARRGTSPLGEGVDDSRVCDDPGLLVPRKWTRMGPILAATYAVLGVINLDLPPIRAIIVGLLSILLAFLAGEFLRLDRERRYSRSKRLILVSFAMVAPVFASGACIAMWMVCSKGMVKLL